MDDSAEELLRRIAALCPGQARQVAARRRAGRRSTALSCGESWAVLDHPDDTGGDTDGWRELGPAHLTGELSDDAPPAAPPPAMPEPQVWFPAAAVSHVLTVADTTGGPFPLNGEVTWPPDARGSVGLDEDGIAATDGYRHHRARSAEGGFSRTGLVSAASVASVVAFCPDPDTLVGISERPSDRSPFGSLVVARGEMTLRMRVPFHDSWMPDPRVDPGQLSGVATLPAAALSAQLDRYGGDARVRLSTDSGSLTVSDEPTDLRSGSGFVPAAELRDAFSTAADPADVTVELRWGPPGSVLWCRRGPLEATLRTTKI